MPRWRQKFNKETGKHELVPVDDAARKADGIAVHGDIEPFRSPIDGTVISDRKQLREHCKRHGVVPAAEFSPEFYARKAKERERLYNGERTRQEIQRDRMRINEIINQHERR